MLEIVVENSFDKDYKKRLKCGLDKASLLEVINKLQNQESLPAQYRDHKLKGEFQDFRECHIKPDLLLIYKIAHSKLYLVRLGSHSELFKK